MDPCFSGEDLIIKTRKPYTITKQRERWTEEEHNRFLEALKLYGRAWQRIEEHIGTKTAIQIRSHAQKFFTKLEKETSVKGEGNGLDIEIPPPRPKRKPVNPYPRKKCGASVGLKDENPSDSTSASLSTAFVKETQDLCDGAIQQKSVQEKDDCVEALNLELVPPCSSPTSTNSSIASEATEKSSNFRQFFPLVDGSRNKNGSAEFLLTATANHVEEDEEKQLFTTDNSRVTLDLCVSPEVSSHGAMAHDPIDETSHNSPRHVPVHILGGSFGNTQKPPVMQQSISNQSAGAHGHQNVYTNSPAAASENVGDGPRPSIPSPHVSSHPFLAPILHPEDYQSFMQLSSTFSSLILSALAKNAAMYAAASLASTGWPWFNLGTPLEPSANSSGIPQSRPFNPTSSTAAIAGATVAAATAWWTAHGFPPFCPQYHRGFACSPAAQMAGSQGGNINGEVKGNGADPTQQCRQPDAEIFNAPNSTLKPPSSSSSSDSEANEAEKIAGELDLAENKSNTKLLDRYSSGSNTLSSNEVEPDSMEIAVNVNEEKHIKTKETKEEPNAVLPTMDPSSRRSRSSISQSDPWKEVSEEGRLAFQALFSREVLPQSFPSPHDLKNKIKKQCCKPVEEDGDKLTIFRLGGNQGTESCPFFDIGKKQASHLSEELKHTKVKGYQTGFRLYKRCSMEAKEIRIPEEQKNPKKLRLQPSNNCHF